jgi:hypothetical protein
MRFLIIALAVMILLGSGNSDPAPPAPPMKGDPNIEHQLHPDYPTAPPPDPPTTGRWRVYAVGTDYTNPAATPRYYVVCWIDSDEATFREVDITRQRHDEYSANDDTGSIPCPG